MRLLLDEMIGQPLADALAARGADAVAIAAEPAMRGAPDELVLQTAAAQQRVLVTFNVVDFAGLHQQWLSAGRVHAGILLVPASALPLGGALVGPLVRSLLQVQATERLPGANQVHYLKRVPR